MLVNIWIPSKSQFEVNVDSFFKGIGIHISGLFRIRLFCWNWNFFIESTEDESKS